MLGFGEAKFSVNRIKCAGGVAVVLLCGASTGCGPDSNERSLQRRAFPLTGQEASQDTGSSVLGEEELRALPACSTSWAASATISLENLRQQLVGYICNGEAGGPPEVAWLDGSKKLVFDVENLRILDGIAFKEEHLSLDPALEEVLKGTDSSTPTKVHVLFRVDEPSLLEAKEEAFANASPSDDSAVRAAAAALVDEIGRNTAGRLPVKIHSRLDAPYYGPPRLIVETTPEAIRAIGKLESVQRILPDPGEGEPTSTAFYENTLTNVIDSAGYDGNGRRVAILEGGRPDSTRYLWPGLVSGSCSVTYGNLYACHCPSGGTTAHSRQVAGMISNSSVHLGADNLGGTADAATWISANFGGCTPNGPDTWTSAVNWSLANGASVVNTSWAFDPGSPQNIYDVMLDYYAVHSPYPFVAATAGNGGWPTRAAYNLYNGLVVGASVDGGSTNRASSTIYLGTQAANYNVLDPSKSYLGQEVPSLVAPGIDVDTAGYNLPTVDTVSGTSFATPIVAGIGASLQEWSSATISRPELTMVSLLASADVGVEGVWPLDLGDTTDDIDGVGLVNASEAQAISSVFAKRNGGDAAAVVGNDYGTISSTTTPNGTLYSEVYNASVANGKRLRVASALLSSPVCPAGLGSCTANQFPWYFLGIDDGTTTVWSANLTQTWQYITKLNSSGSTKTYQIRVYLYAWPGSGTWSSYYALGWSAQ